VTKEGLFLLTRVGRALTGRISVSGEERKGENGKKVKKGEIRIFKGWIGKEVFSGGNFYASK